MSTTYDPWPIRWGCETHAVDVELLALAHSGAQQWLDSLSGQRFGTGTTTGLYRPEVGVACMPTPVFHGSHWTEWAPGACCQMALSPLPVRQVLSVKVDGVTLAPNAYAIEGAEFLRRTEGCWPSSDGCAAPRIEVTHRFGRNVPPLGQLALGQFACELLKAYQNKPCKLPTQVLTTVTRQGVTGSKQLSAEGKAELADNLPIVKAFLDATNPKRLPRAPRMMAPWTGTRV